MKMNMIFTKDPSPPSVDALLNMSFIFPSLIVSGKKIPKVHQYQHKSLNKTLYIFAAALV